MADASPAQFARLMEPLLAGRELTPDQAVALMEYLTSGEATDAQVGAAVTALRVRGATASELAAFAGVLLKHSVGPEHSPAGIAPTPLIFRPPQRS